MRQAFSKNSAMIKVLAGALFISFSSVMVKLTQTTPVVAAFYRVLFAGIALFFLAIHQKHSLWAGFGFFGLAMASGFFWAMDLGVWHFSIHYIGPGLATLILNFQVFLMTCYGILILRERPGVKFYTSIPLAFLGLYLIVGVDWASLGPQYRLGVGLALIAAVCYTLYLLTLRKQVTAPKHLSPLSTMAMISLCCAFFLGTGALFTGESFTIPRPIDWFWLLIYGLCCHSLGWIMISSGMPKIPASRTGLVLLLQPALAFIWDILFFKRPTSLIEALGAFLALLAIYLGVSSTKKKA